MSFINVTYADAFILLHIGLSEEGDYFLFVSFNAGVLKSITHLRSRADQNKHLLNKLKHTKTKLTLKYE